METPRQFLDAGRDHRFQACTKRDGTFTVTSVGSRWPLIRVRGVACRMALGAYSSKWCIPRESRSEQRSREELLNRLNERSPASVVKGNDQSHG